ncbi:MAG: PQQ-binding-like beta-propeller repeat protein [Chloroflexi bacterium]|nr:PQQ-binding-like beta-propeller repeat protein [Chloroflexota bacterium]
MRESNETPHSESRPDENMVDQNLQVRLQLFGPPHVEVDDQVVEISNRKAFALLAYLALEQGFHNRSSLEKLLWPDYSETRASANLRRTLWVLRQSPIAALIDEDPEKIQLQVGQSLWIDVIRFQQDLAVLGSEPSARDNIGDLEATIDLYQGDFLQDLSFPDTAEFESWVATRREKLQVQVLDALDGLTASFLDMEEHRAAQRAGWRALEIDRFRESAVRGLMLALDGDGQLTAALAQYENLRRSLEIERVSKPSPETVKLYQQIQAEAAVSVSTRPQEKRADSEQPLSMPVFLFTDIENSTPLWDRHREAMLQALLQHNAILKEYIEKHGGRIEENRGDGVRAVFESGRPLEAALGIQLAFGQADWGELDELRIRIGLYGVSADWEGYDYFREGDAVFGPALNYAARVMDAAWGGQTLVSKSVDDALQLPDNASWQDFGLHDLKGCEEPVHILGLQHPDLPHKQFPPLRTLTTASTTDLEAEGPRSSPYRGLFAFQEQDAPFFFGREAFTELLVESAHRQPMVAVVGPSGSGKSSVVHAGLLPQLRKQREWLITQFRPGSRPFHALAAALIENLEPDKSKTELLVETNKLANSLLQRDLTLMDVIQKILGGQLPGTRVQLVGDQFEELYTLVPDAQLRNIFMDVLTDAVFDQQYRPKPIFSLTITLRADFLGQALAHRPFADALQESDVKLGPMTRSELNRAIENPAEKAHAEFEAGLVPRILDDVGDEPGNLPLLEFALAMLWEHKDGEVLTHEAYDAIDRVEGALAKHADSVFEELGAEDKATTRRIFVQVVRPGEGTEDTRRLAMRSELGDSSWSLVQRLADARLLVTGRDPSGAETVEVVHEALIHGWDRLRGWIEADREFRVWQERTRALVRQWESSERDAGALLRGLPLAASERWFDERKGDLSEVEIEFIGASIAGREGREEAERAQQERERALERAALRRLRVIAGVLGAAAIIGTALTVGIFNQSRIAQRRAAEIQSLSLVRAAEQAFENHDPELALALAMEANKGDQPPIEVLQTIRMIAFSPGVARGIQAHDGPIVDIRVSPDGRRLASASGRLSLQDPIAEDNSIALWDVATGELVQRFAGHTDSPTHVEFSPDQRFLLSSSLDGSFIQWDLETGVEIRRVEGRLPLAGNVDYLRDGAMGSDGPSAILRSVKSNEGAPDPFFPLFVAEMEIGVWDLQTGRVIYPFQPDFDEAFIKTSQISGEGRILITAQNSRVGADPNAPYSGIETLIAWDVTTGEVLRRLEVNIPGLWTTSIEISPDESTALIGMEGRPGGALIIWDLETGEQIRLDNVGGFFIHHFSPDGGSAYIDRFGQGLEQIDARTGDSLRLFGESPFYVTFSEDGSRMMSFRPMILWNPTTGDALVRFNPSDDLEAGLLMPDGRTAVTGHGSGMLRFWDLGSGVEGGSAVKVRVLQGHGNEVTSAIFSPDGRLAISGGGEIEPFNSPESDNSLVLWDVEDGTVLRRLEGHDGTIWSVAFSPDGRLAASGAQDRSVILWDIESGNLIQRWDGLGETVMALAFTRDGSALLVGIGSPYDATAADPGLVFLDVQSGSEIWRSATTDGTTAPQVWSLAISPDGRTALTGFNSGGLAVWDLESGEKLRNLEGPAGLSEEAAVEGVAFTPDGKAFLTGAFDGSVILWDFLTGEIIRTYLNDAGTAVHLVDISPDGSAVIAAFGLPGGIGESTKAVILWDLQTGEELERFEGHTEWVRGTAFSPDGSKIISASGDGTVRIWEVAHIDLFDWIDSNRYVRDLTPEELQRFGLESSAGP